MNSHTARWIERPRPVPTAKLPTAEGAGHKFTVSAAQRDDAQLQSRRDAGFESPLTPAGMMGDPPSRGRTGR